MKSGRRFALFGLLTLSLMLGCGLSLPFKGLGTSSPSITNFEECAKAGNPILETYPPQCRTADGRQFVQEIRAKVCSSSKECGEGYICNKGQCAEFVMEVSCQMDNDCQLINRDFGFGCCWAGACEAIDYAQPQWVAVNKNWLNEVRAAYCPSKAECGPAPGCPSREVNANYQARCLNQICQKLPK